MTNVIRLPRRRDLPANFVHLLALHTLLSKRYRDGHTLPADVLALLDAYDGGQRGDRDAR